MSSQPILLNFHHLTDLAFESPQQGVVNVNLLHTLLHLLCKKLDLDETLVEIVGDVGEKYGTILKNCSAENFIRDFRLVDGRKKENVAHPTFEYVNEIILQLNKTKADYENRLAEIDAKVEKIDAKFNEMSENVQNLADCMSNFDARIDGILKDYCGMNDSAIQMRNHINCLEMEKKNRDKQVQEMTEMINNLSVTKADKEALKNIASRKADRKDLEHKVDGDVFKNIHKDVMKNVGQMSGQVKSVENLYRNLRQEMLKFNETYVKRLEWNKISRDYGEKFLNLEDAISDLVEKLRPPVESTAVAKKCNELNCVACGDGAHATTNEPAANCGEFKTFNMTNKAQPDCRTDDRFCGGYHTVVKCEEKVVKRTNFLQDYNVKKTKEDYRIQGTDGLLYRSCSCNRNHK